METFFFLNFDQNQLMKKVKLDFEMFSTDHMGPDIGKIAESLGLTKLFR